MSVARLQTALLLEAGMLCDDSVIAMICRDAVTNPPESLGLSPSWPSGFQAPGTEPDRSGSLALGPLRTKSLGETNPLLSSPTLALLALQSLRNKGQ